MQSEYMSEFSLNEIVYFLLLSPWFLFILKQCASNCMLPGSYWEFPTVFIFREIKVRGFDP